MILTVTANVAIDRTYVVDHLQVGAVHKVRRVYAHTGGKGVNVSRCVQSLGGDTLATGLIGRPGFDQATLDLADAGIRCSLFAVDAPPRQTVTVTAQDGTTTAFDELGPTLASDDWADFERHVSGLLKDADMIVIAGSLPPGAHEASLANLIEQANRQEVPVMLDARGAAMRAAQNQNPLVSKLNRNELAETIGRELMDEEDVIAAARDLRAAGAQHVVVTLGDRGAIGVGDEVWRVVHPAAEGNAIGAGDAFSAALALALTSEQPFEQALRQGAAAALASLKAPTAGALDRADFDAALSTVEIHLSHSSVPR